MLMQIISNQKRENYLNDGLYKNICQRLNCYVKNVEKNFMDGNARKENIAQTNAGLRFCIGKHPIRKGQEKEEIVIFVMKNSMLLNGRSNQIEENIALRNVIGKTNPESSLEREILSILTEGLRNMLRHSIFQLSGEDLGRKYIRGIIILARKKDAERWEENCTPIILYRSEFAMILSISQILSRCAEGVMVLNNRQEVE
jgi:hypothetical protein